MDKCKSCKKIFNITQFLYKKKVCTECLKKTVNHCKICGKKASYNFKNEKKGITCRIHKEKNMINIFYKLCEFTGCETIPNYNFRGFTKARFCAIHKEIGMINIKKQCKFENCGMIPSYNFKGNKSAIYCATHKKEGMIDVVHKTCIFENCNVRPCFNFKNNKAIYCTIHKKEGMIDVTNKLCNFESCEKIASFNYVDKKPLYCAIHKHEGMINVKNKRCQFLDCDTIPNYNYKEYKKGIYCVIHKHEGMVNVTHKLCEFEKCNTRPSYAYPNNTPSRCTIHKLSGMIYNPKTKCIICKESAEYGICIPRHCFIHKLEDEINLVERKCKNCDNIDIVNKDGICINFCLATEKYYTIYRKNIKYKETKIYNLLKEKFGEPYSYDKCIDTQCGKERPDIVFECASHFIIIEVDEFMHKKSNYACEKERIQNICFAFGMPCIFIRYNPDNYRVKNIIQNTSDKEKESVLIDTICTAYKDCPTNLTSDFCRLLYLYYDDFDTTNLNYQHLEIY